MTPRARKALWLAVQAAFLVAALWMAGRYLLRDWSQVKTVVAGIHVRWPWAIGSAVVVAVTYAVLVETWRAMLRIWRAELSFKNAATIWIISNLGRYLPGKLWQIAAMSGLAQRCGVSPVVAAGSSLIINLANVLTGILVVLITGAPVLTSTGGPDTAGSGPWRTIAFALVIGLVFLSVPAILPRLVGLAARVTGRSWSVPSLPRRALIGAVVGTAVAWVLYGLAFQFLARAVWGQAPGAPTGYIAAFTFSYLVGYLALLAPGGIVVREVALVEAVRILGLASPSAGLVLALASRVWLTVVEIVVGLLFVPLLLRLPTTPVIDESTKA